jgi:hypothetical protein
VLYRLRTGRMHARAPGGYDNSLGPVCLSLILIVTLTIDWVMKLRGYVDPVTPAQ